MINHQYPAYPIFNRTTYSTLTENPQSAQVFVNSSPEFETMKQRLQMLQFMQMKALYCQRMQQAKACKEEANLQEKVNMKHEICAKEEKNIKLETCSTSLSNENSVVSGHNAAEDRSFIQLSLREQINFNAYLLKELEKIVRFILVNMGKLTQTEMENSRNQYASNPAFLQIYDKLVMKYYSARKCKEDIVRYILRKAFKVIKGSISKEEKVCGKKATLLLCKRFFPSNFDQIEKSGADIKDGDELLEFMLPYRKNSKNKTMNNNFVEEIFSSEKFCREYQKFLRGFNELIKEDNDKKTDKLITFLAECIKKDCIGKLASFSRLPWLDIWMEDTRNVADSMLPEFNGVKIFKKEEF